MGTTWEHDLLPTLAAAGGSQQRAAASARARAAAHLREHDRLIAQSRRNDVAATSERAVALRLAAAAPLGWRLLVDRRWATAANVDMFLVGPGGVLVVDAKAWAEPRITGTTLWMGDAPATDEVATLLALTSQVDDVVGGLGLSPLLVHPVLVFTGAAGHLRPTPLGRPVAVGEAAVVTWATRFGHRIGDDQVEAIAAALEASFPQYEGHAPHPPAPILPPVVLPTTEALEQETLVDVAELEAAVLEAATAQPVEAWMTWLHPSQLAIVRKSQGGPGRLRGAAGTGKTVVALHRAAHLAAHCGLDERVLYATYVRTLPQVLASLLARLSPRAVEHVEFTGIHAFAMALLRERDVPVAMDVSRAQTLFNKTWAAVGRFGPLGDLDLHPRYWDEEVLSVIKGRGLARFEEYRDLKRVGRRVPLKPVHREAVWDLHVAYDVALREAGVHDAADLLSLALAELRHRPVTGRYRAVIVDEVQDLTLVGVQLMHALVGDTPDGLLLVGDGHQAIYPGGFTLAEAGIVIPGARSTILRNNYRNASEVVAAATAVLSADDLDDEGDAAFEGTVDVVRRGGMATRVDASDDRSLDEALISALRDALAGGVRPGDCALLTSTTSQAVRWHGALRRRGFTTIDLPDYRGETCDRVKVGTVKRAKGLEFAHVFLPLPSRAAVADDDGARLARRELYVGITRARDGVWIGQVTPTTEPLRNTSSTR